MSEKRVVLTGSEGVVGKVLTGYTDAESADKPHLEATITRVDVRSPDGRDVTNPFEFADLTDAATIERLMRIHDTWIHGAWAGRDGILIPTSHNPENLELMRRMLKVAAGMGAVAAPKIVLFSTVNTHVPLNWQERQAVGDLIDVDEPPTPHYHNRGGAPGPGTTRHGHSKLEIEAMAQEFASEHGLDITVFRLGGVNLQDTLASTYPPYINVVNDEELGKHFDVAWEDAVRTDHIDVVEAVQAVVDRERKIGNFVRTNLVSDYPQRVHKLSSDKT